MAIPEAEPFDCNEDLGPEDEQERLTRAAMKETGESGELGSPVTVTGMLR